MKPNPPIHRVDAKLLLDILLTHVLLTDTHTFNTVDTYSSSDKTTSERHQNHVTKA